MIFLQEKRLTPTALIWGTTKPDSSPPALETFLLLTLPLGPTQPCARVSLRAAGPGPPAPRPCPYQVHRVHVSVLVAVLLQQLAQVRDVAGSQAQRVQFGKLGVGRHPGQAGLESGEGFAQHAHPGPLAGVGGVPLRLLALSGRALGRERLLTSAARTATCTATCAARASHTRPLPLAAPRDARGSQRAWLLFAVGVLLLRGRIVAGRDVAALGIVQRWPLGGGGRVDPLQPSHLHVFGVTHRAGGHRLVPGAHARPPSSAPASLADSGFRSLEEDGA